MAAGTGVLEGVTSRPASGHGKENPRRREPSTWFINSRGRYPGPKPRGCLRPRRRIARAHQPSEVPAHARRPARTTRVSPCRLGGRELHQRNASDPECARMIRFRFQRRSARSRVCSPTLCESGTSTSSTGRLDSTWMETARRSSGPPKGPGGPRNRRLHSVQLPGSGNV